MSRPGIPAFDAGVALAEGRKAQLRRALDRLIQPKSALAERLSEETENDELRMQVETTQRCVLRGFFTKEEIVVKKTTVSAHCATAGNAVWSS